MGYASYCGTCGRFFPDGEEVTHECKVKCPWCNSTDTISSFSLCYKSMVECNDCGFMGYWDGEPILEEE